MARVFLYAEQATALLTGELPLSEMVATVIDDGDVFHVAARNSRRHGTPVPFTLRLLDRTPDRPIWDDGTDAVLRVEIWPGPEGRASIGGDGMGAPDLEICSLRAGLGSRAKGLIETEVLRDRTVAVVGLGSGGSPIALALAQAGVGRMILADHDRLDVSNVTRHVCGLDDLGRWKTWAVADLLRAKNPFIDVVTHEADILADWRVTDAALSGADLIIAATDTDNCEPASSGTPLSAPGSRTERQLFRRLQAGTPAPMGIPPRRRSTNDHLPHQRDDLVRAAVRGVNDDGPEAPTSLLDEHLFHSLE